MAITDWPEHERPRERLLKLGPEALTDAELLAIFLRVGVRGKSAVDLARELLARFDNNLPRLGAATLKEIAAIPGMGPAKAVQLQAVLELARRALRSETALKRQDGAPPAPTTGCSSLCRFCPTPRAARPAQAKKNSREPR